MNFSDCQKNYGYTEVEWRYADLTDAEISFHQTDEIEKEADNALKTYIDRISNRLADKILELLRDPDCKEGGILGFLHGKREIEDCVNQIKRKLGNRKDIRVFPLYAELSDNEQDLAKNEFAESDKVMLNGELVYPRRVVIATNIAETSITVPDIVYVIDTGLIKQSEWNPLTCRQELRTRFHSKDGCKQRWGRAGRVQKGFVYKFYTKEQFIKYFPHHTSPEIERECIDDVVFKSKASGIEDIDPKKFSWLQRPNPQELTRALNVFNERKLVDEKITI